MFGSIPRSYQQFWKNDKVVKQWQELNPAPYQNGNGNGNGNQNAGGSYSFLPTGNHPANFGAPVNPANNYNNQVLIGNYEPAPSGSSYLQPPPPPPPPAKPYAPEPPAPAPAPVYEPPSYGGAEHPNYLEAQNAYELPPAKAAYEPPTYNKPSYPEQPKPQYIDLPKPQYIEQPQVLPPAKPVYPEHPVSDYGGEFIQGSYAAVHPNPPQVQYVPAPHPVPVGPPAGYIPNLPVPVLPPGAVYPIQQPTITNTGETIIENLIGGIPFDCRGKPTGHWRDHRFCDVFHACVFGIQRKTYSCPFVGERTYFDEISRRCEFVNKGQGGCSINAYYH